MGSSCTSPSLQAQAALELADKRQVEDRERRAIEAKATGAPPRIPSAGKPRDEEIADRDHLIATLKESYKITKGIGRNRKIAKSLDEQGKTPPDDWGVRTFFEAMEKPKTRRAFSRLVAKAKYKKIPTS